MPEENKVAAVPPPNAEQTTAESKPAIDPLVASIAASFDKILGPDGNLQPKEPVKLDSPESSQATLTLSDMAALERQKAENAAKEKKAETAETPSAATPPPAAVPAAAAEPSKKVVVKKIEAAPPPPPASAAPPAATPAVAPPPPLAVPDASAEYVKGLSETQREEYDLASYAEKAHPELKGRAAATLEFFKKTDAYAAAHPEQTPDSEEFREFVQKNQPQWKPGERRKLERAMIEEEAAEKAKAAIAPDLENLRREQHALKVQPEITAATKQFRSKLATHELPEHVNPISKDVAARINEVGYNQAAKEFPIEAPIIQQHIAAAHEFSRIARNAVPFDQNNPTHRWLNDFVMDQGKKMASRPVAERTVNGKVFMPLHEYAALTKSNPAEAERYWTLNDSLIMDMIAYNAALSVGTKISELEAAGFKRENSSAKKSAKSESAAVPLPNAAAMPPPKADEHASPKAGTSAAPGAGVATPPKHPNASFLNTLVPGSAVRILGS